jgi:hypothetical protein
LPPQGGVFRYGVPRVGLKQAQAAAAPAPSEANSAAAAMHVHLGATSDPYDILVSTDCPCWYGVDAFLIALYICGNDMIALMTTYHYLLNLLPLYHCLTEGPPSPDSAYL